MARMNRRANERYVTLVDFHFQLSYFAVSVNVWGLWFSITSTINRVTVVFTMPISHSLPLYNIHTLYQRRRRPVREGERQRERGKEDDVLRVSLRPVCMTSRSVDRISVDDVILTYVWHLPRPDVEGGLAAPVRLMGGGQLAASSLAAVVRRRSAAARRRRADPAGWRQQRERVDRRPGHFVQHGVVISASSPLVRLRCTWPRSLAPSLTFAGHEHTCCIHVVQKHIIRLLTSDSVEKALCSRLSRCDFLAVRLDYVFWSFAH